MRFYAIIASCAVWSLSLLAYPNNGTCTWEKSSNIRTGHARRTSKPQDATYSPFKLLRTFFTSCCGIPKRKDTTPYDHMESVELLEELEE